VKVRRMNHMKKVKGLHQISCANVPKVLVDASEDS
jgi:hypothetical protein